ncbi:MAG: TrkA family potassium uptake protein [Deferrisomatales bacterium]|nr:TrkA family potassium uptake protein [Deferrisomatales bacterium]
MRHVGVIGLGNFGMGLSLELSRLGLRVTAVDANPEKARDAQAHVAQALVADATDAAAVAALGVERMAAVVVSLGGHMETSILAVLHLSRLGVPEIVAKALGEDHAEILSRVGATQVVFPEKDMALRLALRLSSQTVLDYLSLTSGLSVVELAPTREMTGKTLAQLALGRESGIQVLAVRELVPDRVIIAPRAEQVVKDSDILVVMGPEERIARLREG